jgi:hypothetical protein
VTVRITLVHNLTCAVAVTPKDYAVDCIGRAQRLAGLPGAQVDDDVLRFSLALGVAALDTLVRWIILRAVDNDSNSMPRALGRLNIELGELTRFADQAREVQRRGVRWKPWVVVKNGVQAKLLRRTFQSKQDVVEGLAMAGVAGGWDQICKQLGEKPDDVTNRLGTIVLRRKQIVHEGDYRRMARPRQVETIPIHPAAVRNDLAWLERLIVAVASIAGY